ncbi:hypothetical protein [Aquabacterium sp.]|uniref:hypothetical protein n=1 Tax=Aquabacterium sp. TaxID=1872578 RepID=UPI0024877325|nr:hypothetical protein [Aquabacterium sp.]MDI1259546.1 hypothetical protein [Aquabacterium sp.]
MTHPSKLVLAAALAVTTTLLVACGGGDDGPVTRAPADVTAQVPPAAATSPSVATSYVGELSAVPMATSDTLEPVAVPDMLASDDTGEPSVVN